MSILSSILAKILPRHDAPTTAASSASASSPSVAPAAPSAVTDAGASGGAAASPAASSASSMGTAQSSVATAQTVDVAQVLDGRLASAGQPLDWRHSIVDLMKLLDLDSSLTSRKELAQELGYSGDMSDSASMNMWLHKQVMQKVAANGGKVPAELH